MKLTEIGAVGKITKQNATKDAPIGSEFANVKKLGLGSGEPKELHRKARKNSDPNTLSNLGIGESSVQEFRQTSKDLGQGLTMRTGTGTKQKGVITNKQGDRVATRMPTVVPGMTVTKNTQDSPLGKAGTTDAEYRAGGMTVRKTTDTKTGKQIGKDRVSYNIPGKGTRTNENTSSIDAKEIEALIRKSARARGMDPDTAVAVWRSEGGAQYQSRIQRKGKGSEGGYEASYGPFQLYTGGGLGNEYQQKYGIDLRKDNTPDGIKRQIDFSLDKAKETGWTPWYGAKRVGISKYQGIDTAKAGDKFGVTKRKVATVAPKSTASDDMSFGDAFKAARAKAGGAGGMFTYKGKQYQTNVKGEKYVTNPVSVDEALQERSLYSMLTQKMASKISPAKYEKAGAILHDVLVRKMQKTRGKLRHGLLYYAQQIARQFEGMDYRALADYYKDHWELEGITEDRDVLYHATYEPFLDSIMANGLGGAGVQQQWEDSLPGHVYLARDPEVAESHAEANDDVPDDYIDNIVVLAIDATKLDRDKLVDDENVLDDDSTLAYKGVIPSTALSMTEGKRVPRKKGQPAGSKKHSDLYTDENPRGTIKGLKFATVADAKASVNKIKSSGKKHAHKIQAAIAMEQRAKAAGKKSAAAVYRKYINAMKKKTKKMNELRIEKPDPKDTLGVARKMMPQVKSEDYEEFIDFLQDNGARFEKDTIPARELQAMQSEFSDKGIIKQLEKNIDQGPNTKAVIVSSDNYVLDGHHRWLVAMNTGTDLKVFRVNMPAWKLYDLVNQFEKVYYKDIYDETRGSIGVPLSSGLTVSIFPHRPLKIKKSTPGKLRYDEDITAQDLDQLETFADKMFAKVGIDVEFTRHFLDRVNDERNKKPITMAELTRLFKQEYKRYGKPIAQMGPDQEAVMKDLQTDINLPFVLQYDRENNELDLVAKTVMRKKDFKTPDREFAVEGSHFNNPKNTFLTKADTAYDFLRIGKHVSNIKSVKKGANRDEPDVMIVPYGGEKEAKYLQKQLKRIGYKTQNADKHGDDAHFDESGHDTKPSLAQQINFGGKYGDTKQPPPKKKYKPLPKQDQSVLGKVKSFFTSEELDEDLRDWFKQKWVNIGKKNKDGSHPECGTSGKKSGYAKCVPAAKAAKMTKKEKESAVRRKRAAQNKKGRGGKSKPGSGKKPIRVSTKAKRKKKSESIELCPRTRASICQCESVYNISESQDTVTAVCELMHSDTVKGKLLLKQQAEGPTIIVGKITGLEPGNHGFHIHEFGDMSEGCETMGAHYNPDGVDHGDIAQGHVGDLGNVVADDNGVASIEIVAERVDLRGERSIVGRGIVVHKDEDDLGKGGDAESLKTGNAGDRLACGVVLIKQNVNESINETLDNPYKLNPPQYSSGADQWSATAKTPTHTISFTADAIYDETGPGSAWMFEFGTIGNRSGAQKFDVTGEGDAQRVFATALAALKMFIDNVQPGIIRFTADKGDYGVSRTKLYQRMVQRYAAQYGFKPFVDKDDDQDEFTLVKEGWSAKYKKSINCSNPKGFSQRAHCAGRKKKKRNETKEAPPGTYFTKSGNLVKGRLTKDAKERGARQTDPKDLQRSKVPPVTQYNESFVKPQFDREWDEAARYPEFVKIGKQAWIELASKGKAVEITDASDINNTEAADPSAFDTLDSAKQRRALAQLERGVVEMPIVAVYSDGYKELIAGNTRLTAMMGNRGRATVWQFEVPDEVANLAQEDVLKQLKGTDKFTKTAKPGGKESPHPARGMLVGNKIEEGVNDPHIFKAVFMAGGPGSGKGFVVKNILGGTGLRTVNSDDMFEYLMKKADLALDPDTIGSDVGQQTRGRAKELTDNRMYTYLKGRLGLIIDGTGKDVTKYAKQVEKLKALGYDCMMLFVNTSEEVAQQRNMRRERSIPPKMVSDMWNEVQQNLMKFQQVFGADRFYIIDNSGGLEDLDRKENFDKVYNNTQRFLNTPPSKRAATRWIQQQKAQTDGTQRQQQQTTSSDGGTENNN